MKELSSEEFRDLMTAPVAHQRYASKKSPQKIVESKKDEKEEDSIDDTQEI